MTDKEIVCRYMGLDIEPWRGIDQPDCRSYIGRFWNPEMSKSRQVVYKKSPEEVLASIENAVKYQSDWNWLIAVVKKVENDLHECAIGILKDQSCDQEEYNHIIYMYEDINNRLVELRIEPLWLAVVEAIKLITKKDADNETVRG